MALTLEEITGITKARLQGTGDVQVTGVAGFDDAGPHDLTFAGDARFLSRINESRAGAVIVPDSFAPEVIPSGVNLLFSDNPKLAFFKVVSHLFPPPERTYGIHPRAVIGEDVSLGEGVSIGPNAVIGDHVTIGRGVHVMANTVVGDHSCIGDDCVLKPNVTLLDRCRLGNRVIIHSGAVIGSDGYGFTQDGSSHAKQVHTGYVEIGDDVEIGACTTVDRGTLGVTCIGNGVKIDNQVHIAHNVKIGDNTLIVAQVGIAGSTRIGKGVILAGKAGISGHLTIGDHVIVGPYAGVASNVPPNQIVSGIPHMPHKIWLKVANIISRLPDMRKKLNSLEKRFSQLESTTKHSE